MSVLVRLSEIVVGGVPRIRVDCPFHLKDYVKFAGGRWEPKAKFWSIPRTAISIDRLRKAVQEPCQAYGGCELQMPDALRELSLEPVSVHHVEIDEFPDAKMPPWDHQRQGSSMIGQLPGCLLAWDMGSGKTKAAYDAIVRYRLGPVLICCPSSVVSVWEREAIKHVPRDFPHRVVGLSLGRGVAQRAKLMRREYDAAAAAGEIFIAAINYEAAWRADFSKEALRIPWGLVIADECHRISNPQTKIGKFMAKLGPNARRRVGLSGTPMSNGPIDVFGQFLFIEPALFGESYTRFRSRYCIMGGFEGREVVDYQNLEEFKFTMGLVSTRVRLSDVIDLPEYRDEQVDVHLDEDTRKFYTNLRDNFIAEWKDGIVDATNAMTKLLRLQQITSGHSVVSTIGPDGVETQRSVEVGKEKREAFRELIEDMPKDEPVVVFCRFTHDVQAVRSVAAESRRPHYEISGAGNQQKEWEADCQLGLGPVIAVQIQAGGVGIDLTPARYCIYYSIGFSLTDYLQSRARVHRPGQKRGVIYYHLIAPGTVDVSVYGALSRRQKVVDAVIEDLTKGLFDLIGGDE